MEASLRIVCEMNLPTLQATLDLGCRLGRTLFPGAVLALNGPLGAGKTQLVRGLAEGLGLRDSRIVTSPTFVLIQEYPARLPIYHFDAYRLKEAREIEDLGIHEYLEGEGVCVIEWANRIVECLPGEHLAIDLVVKGETSRKAVLVAVGPRYRVLLEELVRSG